MDHGKLCEGRAIWAATCCTVPPLHRVRVRKEGARTKSLNGKHYREVRFFPGRPGDPARWIWLRHSQVAQNPSLKRTLFRHALLGSGPLRLLWLRSLVACFDYRSPPFAPVASWIPHPQCKSQHFSHLAKLTP